MNSLKRRLICCCLSFIMLLAMSPPAFAQDPSTSITVEIISTQKTTSGSNNTWFNQNIRAKYPTETKTCSSGDTVTVNQITDTVYETDNAGNKVAAWSCVGYKLSANAQEQSFTSGSASITLSGDVLSYISSSTRKLSIRLLWERKEIQQFTITYNFNQSEISGATIYPVVDTFQDGVSYYYGYNTDGDKNEDVPMVTGFFSLGTEKDIRYEEDVNKSIHDTSVTIKEFSFSNGFTQTYPENSEFAVGSGLAQLRMPRHIAATDSFPALPVADFIARKENEDGSYAYYKLTGWTVTDTSTADGTSTQTDDEIVQQGSEYTATANKTFTAQWQEVTLDNATDILSAPILTTYTDTSTQVKLSQKLSSSNDYSTSAVALDENGGIDYRVTMTPNRNVLTDEFTGHNTNAKYFKPLNGDELVQVDVTVKLGDGLELVTDTDGKSTITIQNSLLKPTGKVKIGNDEIDAEVTTTNGITTVKVELKGASEFALPMQWSGTSNIEKEMTLDFSAKAKEGATSGFTAQVSLEGSIDLSKASTDTGTSSTYADWTETDQLIRYVLGDDTWRTKYTGDDGKLDIVETLQAAKDLEAALEDISFVSNELTASTSVIPATGITVTPDRLTLYSNTTNNTATLTATVTPTDTTQTVTWSSSDTSVATVNANGVVTAVGNGKATITATVGGYSDTCTVTVQTYTSGGGGASGIVTYPVTAPSKVDNGDLTVSHKSASKGTTVTITVKPDNGYELDTLTVTDASGNRLTLTDKGNGKYTFTMPGSKVEIKASFVETEEPIVVPKFTDVPADAYYADAVEWAVKNGITLGTSATTFSPDLGCTRAQVVTFLWRAAGCPTPKSGSNPFTDVLPGTYYYEAVLWAVENGVTVGTSATTFSPDVICSRAQIVTFLWRNENRPTASTVNSFVDVAQDAYYAGAVEWAAENRITVGTNPEGTMFSPDEDCTRAQIVTFLYRYMA